MTEGEAGDDGAAYGGLLGAFRYSLATSESRLFRSYVVVGSVVSLFVTLLFAGGIVTLIAATASAQGGTLTTSRAFYVVVLLGTVAPLLAPVLVVARRLRRDAECSRSRQALFGATGYGYLLALYLGVVATAPEEMEPPATGALAPLVAGLNAVPDGYGLLLPLGAAVAMAVLFRVVR